MYNYYSTEYNLAGITGRVPVAVSLLLSAKYHWNYKWKYYLISSYYWCLILIFWNFSACLFYIFKFLSHKINLFDLFSIFTEWEATRSLSSMFFRRFLRSVIIFSKRFEIQAVVLASDLLRRLWFLLQNSMAFQITRFARNVPLGILKTCCYFSKQFWIQDGFHGHWFADTVTSTSFPLQLLAKSAELIEMFVLSGTFIRIVTADIASEWLKNMASDRLKQFLLLFLRTTVWLSTCLSLMSSRVLNKSVKKKTNPNPECSHSP